MSPEPDDTMANSDVRTRSDALVEAIRPRISGGGSLASDVWRLLPREAPEPPTEASWTPEDGAGRIVLTAAEGDFIDMDPTIEVYGPPAEDDPTGPEPVLASQTLPELSAAVWLAEYYARRRGDAPAAGADWAHGEAFTEMVREAVPGGGSIASDVWHLSEYDGALETDRLTWTNRETGGRLILTLWPESAKQPGPLVEVLVPAPRDDPGRQDPEDENDMTVVYQRLDGLALAAVVWLVEYYARNHDDMVPEDAPPVDVDVNSDSRRAQ